MQCPLLVPLLHLVRGARALPRKDSPLFRVRCRVFPQASALHCKAGNAVPSLYFP